MKVVELKTNSIVEANTLNSNSSCNCGACNCNCGGGGTPTTKCADGSYITLSEQIKEIYNAE